MPPRIRAMTRIFLLLLFTACVATANDDFRYYVFDEIRTDKLHYEHGYDFTINDVPGRLPHLVFYTEYRVYGCAQETFTYTTERCERNISRNRLNKLLSA